MKQTRRKFISHAAAGAATVSTIDPVQALISHSIESMFRNAYAQEVCGALPRNYICIDLYGGLPVWHFLPLTPRDGMGFQSNPRMTNAFDPSGLPIYKSVPLTRNGVTTNLPPLWAGTLPTALDASGSQLGSVPAMDLFEHMFMCRGVYMQADGHVENSIKQVRPNLTAPSLNGLVADAACGKLLPAVGGPSNVPTTAPMDVFVSKSGVGISRAMTYANALAEVMAPFDRTGVGASIDRRHALNTVDLALDAIDKLVIGRNPALQGLKSERQNAETLLKNGIANLSSTWTNLVSKYKALIHASKGALDTNGSYKISGITDLPVDPVDDHTCDVEMFFGNPAFRPRLKNPDIRSMIQAGSELDDMAQGFALCEYMIVNGYSSTVSFQPFHRICRKLKYIFTNPNTAATENYLSGTYFMDEHDAGSRTSIVLMSWYFRSVMACLFELITRLKSANLYSETVVHILSEFGRSPRPLGGSDHGWEGGFLWFFSGALPTAAQVVGNLKIQSADTLRVGTWQAAPVNVSGVDRLVVPGNSVSTIAAMLRIPSPAQNDMSLVSSDGVTLLPALPENK